MTDTDMKGIKNNAGERKSSTKSTEARFKPVTKIVSRKCMESIVGFKPQRQITNKIQTALNG